MSISHDETILETLDGRRIDPADWSIDESRVLRRTTRAKMAAGFRGLKLAVRGDSSFFAHTYRGVLIVFSAIMLGVDLWGWCLLVFGAALVLSAELTHSAVETLSHALDAQTSAEAVQAARDIADAGVLIAASSSGAITVVVLTVKLGNSLGWW
jgi:diacylglycerol kinase